MMENEITQSVLCLPYADKVLDEALSRGGDYAEKSGRSQSPEYTGLTDLSALP